jgi:hypothetical protein
MKKQNIINKLERALAVAIMNQDRIAEQKLTRALEMAVNKTDFPKVSA